MELPTFHKASLLHPEGVQQFLYRRQAYLDHWFFVVRLILGLGLIGYLVVDMLAAEARIPTGILLVLSYVLANVGVRLMMGRDFRHARWVFAALDLLSVLVLRHGFQFEALVDPNATMVGLFTLGLIAYALFSDPKLSATCALLSLVALVTTFCIDSVRNSPPDVSFFASMLAYRSHPLRALLLFSYLGTVGLITHRLATHLHTQVVKYSTELQQRAHAAVITATERARRERLEEVSLLRKDLVSLLEQELAAPVKPLVAALDILEDSPLASSDDAALLDVARTSAQRIQHVVRGFQQFVEVVTRDEMALAPRNMPLQELLDGLAQRADVPSLLVRGSQNLAICADPALCSMALLALLRHLQQTNPLEQPVTITSHAQQDQVVLEMHTAAIDSEPVTLDALDTLLLNVDSAVLFSAHTGFERLLAQHAFKRLNATMTMDMDAEEALTIRCVLPGKNPNVPTLQGEALQQVIRAVWA